MKCRHRYAKLFFELSGAKNVTVCAKNGMETYFAPSMEKGQRLRITAAFGSVLPHGWITLFYATAGLF
jgi:hypothetical protein